MSTFKEDTRKRENRIDFESELGAGRDRCRGNEVRTKRERVLGEISGTEKHLAGNEDA